MTEKSSGDFSFGGGSIYLYPNDLTAKATIWLWQLRDVGIISLGLLFSVLALNRTGILVPLVLTAMYAFVTIRYDGTSILDFIRYASAFFFTRQHYEWRCL